jgi:uncharacterized protein
VSVDQRSSRLRLSLPCDRIAAFAQRWRVAELAVFGSALRDDFSPQSDVDFLVTFLDGSSWSLSDFARMEEELSAIVGREVDLVERGSVEASENYIRRRHILRHAEPVYVA